MCFAIVTACATPTQQDVIAPQPTYGLIVKMTSVEGGRDELASIMTDSIGNMPGVINYTIAKDPKDANTLWITETWETKQLHDDGLQLPSVRAAVAKGGHLIANAEQIAETIPVGGTDVATSR